MKIRAEHDAGRLMSRAGLGIGVSVLALMCAAQPAFAQTTGGDAATQQADPAQSADDSGEANDIVVVGVRQALANAQNLKRNADTVVDAITADDIGALPDRSVNEALQRVAGVAITRFAAATDTAHFSVEGSGVTIRGLSYVRGEFNGRDSFGVSGGREIGFNDVPTELVGSVEVYKNLTADLIEGGISGTVSINTRKPFDSKDTLLYLSGTVNYGDYADRSAPAVVGLFSKQWQLGNGGRFGILASASYNQQFSRSDSVFYSAFLPRYNDDTNGNGVQDAGEGRVLNAGTPYESTLWDRYPVPAGRNSVFVPLGAGMRSQQFDRTRIGYAGAAQYENASGNFLVTAQFLRAESKQTWLDRTVEPNVYYADANQIFPQGYNPSAPIAGQNFASPTYDENGVFTSGTLIRNGGGQYTTLANRFFSTDGATQDHTLNVKWEPTERLRLNFDGQYVFSKGRDYDDVIELATFSGVTIDGRGKVPQITTVTPDGSSVASYFRDPTKVFIRDAMNNRTHSDGDEWAFRGDAEYDLSDVSFLRKIRVGGRYSTRDQTVKANDYNNWGAVSDTWTSGLATADKYQNELAGVNFPNFFRGQAVTPPSTWGIPDQLLTDHDAVTDLLRRATAASGGGYTPLEDRAGATVDGYFLPQEVYRTREKTYAAYARLDFGLDSFAGGSLSGNIGLRFVHTSSVSDGSVNFPNISNVLGGFSNVADYCASPNDTGTIRPICTVSPELQASIVAFSNAGTTPQVARQSYDKWLPSLNIKYQATDTLLFRLAASKAISRPGFTDLRNFVGVQPSSSNTTGVYTFSSSSRNPFLRPIDAKQVDLTAEWYFAKVGSLTGALFYKQLSNIILDNSAYSRRLTNNGQTFDVTINGPVNVPGSADIKGAEVSYQQTFDFLPGVLRGLGAQATFTYIDAGNIPNARPANGPSDGSRPPLDVEGIYDNLPLAQLSKYNVNVAGFYDLGGLYLRLAYSWRSKYLLTNRDCCFPFLPVYALAAGQMDGSLFYTVNKQFKIGLQVQNLLDSTTRTTFVLNPEGQEAPRAYFKSDRQFSITTRLSF